MQYLIAYVATTVIFFAIDFVWLTSVARSFYRDQIGPLLLDEFKVGIAAAFYAVYIIGIIYFAVKPALEANNLGLALLNGALLGFFCYATYDFTNLATLKGYTTTVALVDIAWGTALTGLSAFLGAWITRAITG